MGTWLSLGNAMPRMSLCNRVRRAPRLSSTPAAVQCPGRSHRASNHRILRGLKLQAARGQSGRTDRQGYSGHRRGADQGRARRLPCPGRGPGRLGQEEDRPLPGRAGRGGGAAQAGPVERTISGAARNMRPRRCVNLPRGERRQRVACGRARLRSGATARSGHRVRAPRPRGG
jgi:hypothetical protein